ncbi:hypothetical protein K435DRAFT_850716 [Dendrothele bispora CBS 962.96]|uniref:Uncharacterized protein n=1 Tax=Dendrothele bispora (strain CBS 962.96) TaxID=1314807 RepID=A0A4S8MNT1_DENBC|nr:hypothetical protein K435DRAFT_850716 [Dendrothele bispora CBS 962.96]
MLVNTARNNNFQFLHGMTRSSSLAGLVGGSLGGATGDDSRWGSVDRHLGEPTWEIRLSPCLWWGGFSTLGKNKAWVDLWKLGGAPPVSPLFESPPLLSAAVLAHPPMGYPTAADNVRGRGGVRRIDGYRFCKSERRV